MARRSTPSPVPPRAAAAIILAVAALAAFTALAVGDLLTTSPTSDETAHLAAGYSYLVTHDYRINPEHPPLAKMFAALPLLGMRVWPAGFRDPAGGTRAFAYLREAWAMSMASPAFAILFGIAQTVKFSAVLLAPIVLVLALSRLAGKGGAKRRARAFALAIAGAAIASIVVMWAVYGFRYSTAPDPEAARAEEIA